MKLRNLFGLCLSLLFSSAIFAHGGDDHKHETREQIAWQLIDNQALLIDVRTDEEFQKSHLKSALHIPYKKIVNALAEKGIAKDRQIVLYCRSGNRAGKAIKFLRKAGFTKVHNGGGLKALQATKAEFSHQ
ncbi:MAG: rhodanese-like domain-containing protein [Psychrobium sp.]